MHAAVQAIFLSAMYNRYGSSDCCSLFFNNDADAYSFVAAVKGRCISAGYDSLEIVKTNEDTGLVEVRRCACFLPSYLVT